MTKSIHSLPFCADDQARILILGSMPGEESLKQQRYYAHPRNLFWDLMGGLIGADRHLPYGMRLALLRKHHIALWDVVRSCRRRRSMDSTITDVTPNNIKGLFEVSPQIHTIFFNGQAAAQLFRTLVLSELDRPLILITLPSTSPANASISLREKEKAWRQIATAC